MKYITGLCLYAIILAAFAFAAWSVKADPRVFIGSLPSGPGQGGQPLERTYVEVGPTNEPGAVAEITYSNQPINDSATDDGEYRIDWNEIEVILYFDHDAQDYAADAVDVVPPDGLVCLPSCRMVVNETESATIYLIPGVMM